MRDSRSSLVAVLLLLCPCVPAAAGEWIEGRLVAGDQFSDGKYIDQFILFVGMGSPRTPVTIEMRSSDLDAHLLLKGLACSGAEITPVTDDDGAGGHDARVSATLDPGVYFVEASSYARDQTGSYRVRLAEPPGLDFVGPVLPLTLGPPVTGRLAEGDMSNSDGSKSDAFLFINSGSSERIEFVLHSGDFQPALYVGTRGERGGDWTVTGDIFKPARLVVDVDAYEMITLGAGSTPGGAGGDVRLGSYTLQAVVVSAATPLSTRRADPPPAVQPFVDPPISSAAPSSPASTMPAPTRIVSGAWVEGRLAPGDAGWGDGSYVDDYALAVRPGDRIVADILSNDFAPYFVLSGAGTSKSGTGSPGVPLSLEDTATESGTLTIRVNSSGTGAQTGSYRVRVFRTPGALSPAPPVARVTGEPGWILGRLAAGDEARSNGTFSDSHVFRGRRGDTVTIRLESDDFDPVLYVTGPGAFMEMNDDADGRNSRVTARLAASGTYRVVVTSFTPAASGSYRLRIDAANGLGTRR